MELTKKPPLHAEAAFHLLVPLHQTTMASLLDGLFKLAVLQILALAIGVDKGNLDVIEPDVGVEGTR